KPIAPQAVDDALASLEGPDYHARRGEIAQAAKQYSDRGFHLESHDWARLARLAHEGGHDEAAREAMENALAELDKDPIGHEGFDEKAKFVRAAVEVGDLETATDLLQTTSPAGLWARHRLALACMKNGDVARAKALWDEALAMSDERGSGGTMAEI